MKKPDIVIFTNSIDAHASCVELVIQKLGKTALKFNAATYSTANRFSVNFEGSKLSVDINQCIDLFSNVSSTWNRRFSKLFSLPKNLHPADEDFTRNNLSSVINGVVIDLDHRFPVNPLASARLFSNKLAQLKFARQVGILVPDTIVSNDVDAVENFLKIHKTICVKPYHTHGWITPTGPMQALATKITYLGDDERQSIRVFPHFFQKFIEKRYEYRITIFGGYVSAVRFTTNNLPGNSSTDWRSSPHYLNSIEPCEIPSNLAIKLKKLMRLLGLRFGTFDFAETDNGQFVFFEVNEAGQWIWTELYSPQSILLQPFSEFLCAATDDFKWSDEQYSTELSAACICRELKSSDEFNGTLEDEYPDEAVHATNEYDAMARKTN